MRMARSHGTEARTWPSQLSSQSDSAGQRCESGSVVMLIRWMFPMWALGSLIRSIDAGKALIVSAQTCPRHGLCVPSFSLMLDSGIMH